MLTIVLPCAGLGSRFKQLGYTDPKPLIKVQGTPMFLKVIDNLGLIGDEVQYVLICQENVKEKIQQYLIGSKLNIKILTVSETTQGACCTVLLAKEYIKKNELIVANCDQLVLDRWFLKDGLHYFNQQQVDGGIWCFLNNHPKYSYVRLNQENYISEVKEKEAISNIATTGIYYWRNGDQFITSAEDMINKNIRTNNEFYLAPSYNQLLENGAKILPYMVNQMYGIGTPEDLDYYLISRK